MTLMPDGGMNGIVIRVLTVDEGSGQPVSGVTVRLTAVLGSGDERTLTTVMSDAAGFASVRFDLSPFPNASAVKIAYGSGRAVTVSVTDLQQGVDLHHLPVGDADRAAQPTHAIPAVFDPDARDALLSPSSIGLTPQLGAPGGLCGQLTPTPMAVRRYRAFQVKADLCKVITLDCPKQKVDIVLGQILEYEVVWYPLGTSLGHLLHTITLAPCEQVTVAISDWMRRETASRQESSFSQQQMTQHMEHDRVIMESLNSDVTSKSVSAAFARSIGASIPIDKVNITAAETIGAAAGWSNSQIAANTTSHLAERIDQAATLVMSQRSTVVFQATASEQRFFQTQTLRNNNQCHTLTKVYYQVNHGFRVVTRYLGDRNAILVRYPNDDFDAKRAYCNAAVLRPALLDASLDKCFDELADALFCCTEKAPGPDVRMDSITITATVQVNHSTLALTVFLNTANGNIQLPGFSVAAWQSGTHSQTLPLASPIDPAIVHSVLIFTSGSGFLGTHDLLLSQLQLTYHGVGISMPLALYSSQAPMFIGPAPWFREVKAEIPPAPAGSNPCVEKSCCVQKLLGHLNCDSNKRFYNTLVWLSEDPNERVMRWSCCAGQDLIGSIENTPLAIYGDYVAFPAGPLVLNAAPPESRVVFLPTPGVYSEGILGQCNTCEIVDPNRYTDWKCPDIPPTPDLGNPQTGTSAGDLKPEGITNQITLSSVPSAPDSILKTLLETLIGSAKSDSESKALLDKLFDVLKETLSKMGTSSGKDDKGGG